MGKMRWLVSLMVVLSVCVYYTMAADEAEQDHIEYGDGAIPIDRQAERDDVFTDDDHQAERVDDELPANRLVENRLVEDRMIEDRLVDDDNELAADRQEEDGDNDGVAEVQSWNSVPRRYGSATLRFMHISTSINYYWGTNTLHKIYRCTRPCSGAWVLVPGGLQQVDVGDMEVWGVNRAHHIYKRSADGAGNWIRVGGLLKHVSASGNGYIWGVNRYDNIYICKKPCSGRWSQVSGKLKQIDGGERYVFGVNSANNMYRHRVDNIGGWRYIPSRIKMKYVSVGTDMVYGVAASNSKIYQCALPCTTGAFTAIDTCLNMKQVEATVGEIVGTTTTGQIMKRSVA